MNLTLRRPSEVERDIYKRAVYLNLPGTAAGLCARLQLQPAGVSEAWVLALLLELQAEGAVVRGDAGRWRVSP